MPHCAAISAFGLVVCMAADVPMGKLNIRLIFAGGRS
jgi:hypothetical protein